ncbi:MAG TPA: choice-of-anchor Q domain-containing protein, partial [Pyrinomonadaceae bacterium]
LNITNSTFFNNSAGFGGGAAIANINNGTVNLTNSTFSGNSGAFGGASIYRASGTVTLKNTIVANGVAGPNCQGTIVDGGGNLQFGGTVVNSCGASIATGDPQLGALMNNGGPADTMALGAGSVAVNLGNATTCSANAGTPAFGAGGKDQRGLNRRSGFCDSGAFEAQPASNTVAGGSGQSTTLNTAFPIALQVAVRDANGNLLGGAAVAYTPPPSGPSATLAGNPTLTNATGVASVIATANAIAGGPYDVAANATGVAAVNFSLTNTVAPPSVTIAKLSNGNAAKLPEPNSGSANMLFTVVLSVPAGAGGASVNYSTADEPAGPDKAVAAQDYTPTSGTLTFASGEQTKIVAVPVLSDSDNAEPDETFRLNLSNPTNVTIVNGSGTGTILTTNTPGTLLISELRAFGPGGTNDPNDDFVEIYNNTDSAHTVPAGGYGLFKTGADCNATPVLIGTIAAGTVVPPRGHFLFTGAAYSLANYGGTNAVTGNASLTADLEANRNIALFATTNANEVSTANRLDAVGFGTNTGNVCDLFREGTNELAVTTNLTLLGQHSYFRQICAFQASCPTPGRPKDTNDNSADFIFADTNGVSTSAGQKLGAPGPENLASPIKRDPVVDALLLDTSVASHSAPNRVRDQNAVVNGTFGTLTLRRRIINNTGASVSRLRFRIVDITSFPSPGGGESDIRALTSATINGVNVGDSGTCAAQQPPAVAPCTVTVQGLTLEDPPAQANGGGMNATLSSGTITLADPLAAGASVNVQFRLAVQTTGTFRFYVVIEALP